MTNQITPPPELLQQWGKDADLSGVPYDYNFWDKDWTYEQYIASRAAQWGANQELEACCEWFVRDWTDIETADNLRAARRPKPSSLKEQALALINSNKPYLDDTAMDTIRRALEALPND